MEEQKCKLCGESYSLNYGGEIGRVMVEEGVCYHCAFWIWQHRLDVNGDRDFAIINGSHYVLEPHTDIPWPVGMCGRKHVIRFKDGRVVVCDNLWHQGTIPEHLREMMPDNAEFLSV